MTFRRQKRVSQEEKWTYPFSQRKLQKICGLTRFCRVILDFISINERDFDKKQSPYNRTYVSKDILRKKSKSQKMDLPVFVRGRQYKLPCR
jgi:hypothetical protein